MSFQELKTRLEWFVEEKGKLEDAETEVRDVRSDTEAIQFNIPADTLLGEVKTSYDDLRSALLDEMNVSLDAGGDLLDSLESAISETGRNYLQMEAQNTEYAAQISILIATSGL